MIVPPNYIEDTRRWIERAVIGLNLCPFAKAVVAKSQVRYVLSDAATPGALLEVLGVELALLRDTPASDIDTTLIVHPQVLTDFLDYNDFLDSADALVAELGLEGTLQVASFHPHYQFAGTDAEDVENATNRSPYPTLHLLREDSVSRAVAAYPDPDAIIQRNVATLQQLGVEGWRKLFLSERRKPRPSPDGRKSRLPPLLHCRVAFEQDFQIVRIQLPPLPLG